MISKAGPGTLQKRVLANGTPHLFSRSHNSYKFSQISHILELPGTFRNGSSRQIYAETGANRRATPLLQ
jgi:hypothetical protein